MMPLRRLAPAVFALVVGMLFGPPAFADLSGYLGGDARVIVLDASGSMRRTSFEGDRVARFVIAQSLLSSLLDAYARKQVRTNTALMVFGANVAWDDSSATFRGDPGRVPADHPLCQDIQTLSNFQPTSTKLLDTVNSLSPRGMTPISLALLEALRSFAGDIDGATLEFVLISDLDSPNCLPPGQDICDTLLPELSRIRNGNGHVKALVLETPVAQLREPLSRCMDVATIPIDPDDPNVAGVVEQLSQTYVLGVTLAAADQTLDPEGFAGTKASYEVRSRDTGKIVASGPEGRFDLPLGDYYVSLTAGTVQLSQSVSLKEEQQIVFNLPASHLKIHLTSGGTAGPEKLRRLAIGRPGQVPVASIPEFHTGDTISLAAGTYLLEAEDETGITVSVEVELQPSETVETRLDFAASTPGNRETSIALEFDPPTLSTTAGAPPKLELLGAGGQWPLDAGGLNLALAPGMYDVVVDGDLRLPFEVQSGASVLKVKVLVRPGWFDAKSNRGAGRFYLAEGGGTVIYGFDGTEVQHSLEQGHYTLSFEGPDGSTQSQDFEIRTGTGIDLVFN